MRACTHTQRTHIYTYTERERERGDTHTYTERTHTQKERETERVLSRQMHTQPLKLFIGIAQTMTISVFS